MSLSSSPLIIVRILIILALHLASLAGISPKTMTKNFRGEAIYTAEQDVHFPALTVGDTLAFAAEARSHRHPPPGLTRHEFALHTRDVIMSVLGIAHTVNTKVGNEYVRGVSGGE